MIDYVAKCYVVLSDDSDSIEFSVTFHKSDLKSIEDVIYENLPEHVLPTIDDLKLVRLEF